jgi:hypothetical protein
MDVRLPDGTVIKGVPDGMSKADLVAKLKANGYDVAKLDAPKVDNNAAQNERLKKQGGTAGDGENFTAAIGKGLVDTWRGGKQLAGLLNPVVRSQNEADNLQGQIDEAKRRDAPLLDTKAGMAGNIVGQVAPAVLAAPLTGPGVVAGAATGAVMGAAQPVATGESRAQNSLIGLVGGGAAPIIARGIGAGVGAVRGMVEPFYEGGRQAIAGRTLARFGIQPGDVQGLTGAPTATGARTTLAEQIARPEGAAGAARLQDAVRSLDPEIAARMTARETENNASRVNVLRQMSGEGGGREFAAAERAGTSGPMYREAFGVDPGSVAIPERELRTLLRIPAIKEAAAAARTNAANTGANVGKSNASGSVEGMHQIKLALEDKIAKAQAKATGAAENEARALIAAKNRLVSFIESVSLEYANARGVHAQMSRPINQMDVAGEVLRRGTSSTTDLAGNARLMPNALTGAMRDENALVRAATGRDLGGLDRVMEPDQLNALRAVVGEVDRGAAVARAGNGPGSGTAQRMASSNLLRQIGLPENMVDNALVQTLMRPIQWGANVAEPRIQQVLLDIIQNPALAQEALRRATPAQRLQLERLISNPQLAQSLRATAPAAALTSSQGGQ